MIFLISAVIAYFICTSMFGLGTILAYLITFVAAYLVMSISFAFLPKDTYVSTEYFCADCGNYLGLSPAVCDRCGCNRYTEDDTFRGR